MQTCPRFPRPLSKYCASWKEKRASKPSRGTRRASNKAIARMQMKLLTQRGAKMVDRNDRQWMVGNGRNPTKDRTCHGLESARISKVSSWVLYLPGNWLYIYIESCSSPLYKWNMHLQVVGRCSSAMSDCKRYLKHKSKERCVLFSLLLLWLLVTLTFGDSALVSWFCRENIRHDTTNKQTELRTRNKTKRSKPIQQNPVFNPTDSRINTPSCTIAEVSEMFWLGYKPRAFWICRGDTLATSQLKGLNFACLLSGMIRVSPASGWWWKIVSDMSTNVAGN